MEGIALTAPREMPEPPIPPFAVDLAVAADTAECDELDAITPVSNTGAGPVECALAELSVVETRLDVVLLLLLLLLVGAVEVVLESVEVVEEGATVLVVDELGMAVDDGAREEVGSVELMAEELVTEGMTEEMSKDAVDVAESTGAGVAVVVIHQP